MRAGPTRDGAIDPTAPSAGRLSAGIWLGDVGRQLPYALRGMRPLQWSKNGLVLLAIVFARRLTDIPVLGRGFLAFAAFCLAASSVYLVNDILDRDRDRLHPEKRLRPIAAGTLSVPVAAGTAVACALGAALLTVALGAWALRGVADPFVAWGGSPALFALTLAGYVALNLAYSLWLKHQVLWDVFIVATGFVLRALAGAFAAPVPISPWFYLCTMFLALVLALGKRRAELLQLDADAESHRANLREYSVVLLDQLMGVAVTSTLITYSLYTFQSDPASHPLMVTIPFVIFGVFRYLYLVYVRADGGRPDEMLWRDRQILASVLLCVLAVLAILYVAPALQHHASSAWLMPGHMTA
jgi:4-hydroxybenzoate polyprenyltransferase